MIKEKFNSECFLTQLNDALAKEDTATVNLLLSPLSTDLVSRLMIYCCGRLEGASEEDRCKRVLIFLKAGADVNYKPNGVLPILHAACTSGEAKLVKVLIESGADVNAICDLKLRPLQLAILGVLCGTSGSPKHAYIDIVETLISKGADIYSSDRVIVPPAYELVMEQVSRLPFVVYKAVMDEHAVRKGKIKLSYKIKCWVYRNPMLVVLVIGLLLCAAVDIFIKFINS